eukprot:4294165-Prymnesium_polylepis.1
MPEASSYWTDGPKLFTNAWVEGSASPHAVPTSASVELHINGVSWSGFESSPCVLGGLEKRPARDFLQLMSGTMGFNALRIPFGADALVSGLQPPLCVNDKLLSGFNKRYTKLSYVRRLPTHVDAAHRTLDSTPQPATAHRARYSTPRMTRARTNLLQTPSWRAQVDMLGLLIQDAGDHGLLVMLDLHRLHVGQKHKPSGSVQDLDLMQRAWQTIVSKLCDANKYWNLFAVDLRNEPYKAHWGEPNGWARDKYAPDERWDTVAAQLGDAILRECPRLLVVVEGVAGDVPRPDSPGETVPGAVGFDQLKGVGTWWGENLRGVLQTPVRLSTPNKIAYSPHTYGPAVYEQQQFGADDFPRNMNAVWDAQFGFIAKQGIAPLLIGEWGGKYHDDPKKYGGKDRMWHGQLLEYIASVRSMLYARFMIQPHDSSTRCTTATLPCDASARGSVCLSLSFHSALRALAEPHRGLLLLGAQPDIERYGWRDLGLVQHGTRRAKGESTCTRQSPSQRPCLAPLLFRAVHNVPAAVQNPSGVEMPCCVIGVRADWIAESPSKHHRAKELASATAVAATSSAV